MDKIDTPTLKRRGILASAHIAPDSEVLHALHKRFRCRYALPPPNETVRSLVFTAYALLGFRRIRSYARDFTQATIRACNRISLLSRYAGLASCTDFSTVRCASAHMGAIHPTVKTRRLFAPTPPNTRKATIDITPQTIHEVDEGRFGLVLEDELGKILDDCGERPGLKKTRKLTITLEIDSVMDERTGALVGVDVWGKAKANIPAQSTRKQYLKTTYNTATKKVTAQLPDAYQDTFFEEGN